MAENKLERANSFRIVGTLKDVKVEDKVGKGNGQKYVSAIASIVSDIEGVEKNFEVRFFTGAVTADGKPSKLYDTYKALPELVGKKIDVNGSISENVRWSEKREQIYSAYELSGRFVNGVADSTSDTATYNISGFVSSGLTEKKNAKGEVYIYEIGVSQANYGGNNLVKLVAHVRPSDRELIKALSDIEVGTTITLNGELDFVTVEVEREKKGGFGKPIIEKFVNSQKNYYIIQGDVITGEAAYTDRDIKELVQAYRDYTVEVQENAKTRGASAGASATVEEKKAISKRQSALI